MVDKFIMVDMNDERTSKIAEVLGNKTSKSILSLISESEKELSASDISSKLKIPLNTTDYNLKKLINTGLIEETKSFFWSIKGKKIKTFKAANKKIIISTKPRIMGVIASALLVGVIGFSAKLTGNIFGISRDVFSNNFYSNAAMQVDTFEKVASSSAGSLIANVPGAAEAGIDVASSSPGFFVNFFSLFNGTLIWFLASAFIGFVGFLLYKKLKGGKL
jgi:DNA-binding transcriptional ArsR family regulator